MNTQSGSTIGSSATPADGSTSPPVVSSSKSLQVDPPLPPPNNSTVEELSSIAKPSNESHLCSSTTTALDFNPCRDTSFQPEGRDIELTGKVLEPCSPSINSSSLGSKEAKSLSCGNLATTPTPPRPSMGVAGSIYTRRRHLNSIRGEDESKVQEIDQTWVKDSPSRFVTRAEFYTSPQSAPKAKQSCDNSEQRKSISAVTPRLLDQHKDQGSVSLSCHDIRVRSQECYNSAFSTPTHGKNCERKIEQVLVNNTNTGKHGQTSFADLRHAQNTMTTRHCQQHAVDQQQLYTAPVFRHLEKSSSTDQVQILSTPSNHCQTPPVNLQQDLALGPAPNSNHRHVQDTASGKCYQTSQPLQQLFRGASARFLDRPTPATVHSRQTSVHVGFSAAEATGPGHMPRSQGQCTICQNLHKEIGELRARHCSLERQLSEKEYETIHLRETIERNEKAILQSFEEVRRKGDVESSGLKRDFENYLRAQLQNSFRNEDALRQHIAMLTQENAQLQDRVTTLKSQREEFATRCIRAEWQLERTKRNVKDLTRELNQRKRETVGVLYAGAMDEHDATYPVQYSSPAAAHHPICSSGIRHWKSEDDMKGLDYKEIGRGSRWNTEPDQSIDELTRRNRNDEDSTTAECIQLLQTELQKTRDEMERGKREFDEERIRWEEEKSKVLSYQRFLQMNYLQLLNGSGIIEADADDRSDSGHKLSAIIEEETL